jgi:8-oxo-dGTP diphosphatase
MRPHIHKSGFLLIREGRVLLCRKRRSTALLILPGGRIENGESAEECVRRELQEELGEVEPVGLTFLGAYEDQAAGDEGHTIRIELFGGELTGQPTACAEIAELVWFGEHDDRMRLAPSIRNRILPDLIERRVLPWSG